LGLVREWEDTVLSLQRRAHRQNGHQVDVNNVKRSEPWKGWGPQGNAGAAKTTSLQGHFIAGAMTARI
jgi:hypothetical protein